jgi:hypothetical protein
MVNFGQESERRHVEQAAFLIHSHFLSAPAISRAMRSPASNESQAPT